MKSFFFSHFWVIVSHDVGHHVNELEEERAFDTQLSTTAHGPTQQPANDVVAPFVARQDAITNRKRNRPKVIRDDFEVHISLLIFPVSDASDVRRSLNDGHKQIRLKVVRNVLQNGSDAFQPHPSVDILLRKRRVASVRLFVVLCEHKVPNL